MKILMAIAALTVATSVTAVEARPFFDPVTQSWQEAKPGQGGKHYNRIDIETVKYDGPHRAGTIIVDTSERRLYLVEEGGKARKYAVGVGKDGFTWSGTHRVTRKAEWPSWTPPPAMRARYAAKGRILPVRMEGGPDNPMGARALYIGSTLYRIHGTIEPRTIGSAVSSGCIRMYNEDVIDLAERVRLGSKVVVKH
ncbi:MAG: L,D-transpeptidase [Pseudomonadota bacterium]